MGAPEKYDNPETWQDPYPAQKSRSWIIGVSFLVVFYVLSIGPTCRLAQKRTISWETVHLLYTPLNAVAGFQPIDDFVQWYISLWLAPPLAGAGRDGSQSP